MNRCLQLLMKTPGGMKVQRFPCHPKDGRCVLGERGREWIGIEVAINLANNKSVL